MSDKKEDIIVRFKDWECRLLGLMYDGGRKAIRLVDVVDGEPVATATVNIVDQQCGDNEVFIKDYSEGAGMFDALREVGLIELPDRFVCSGFVSGIQACALTEKGLSLWESDNGAS